MDRWEGLKLTGGFIWVGSSVKWTVFRAAGYLVQLDVEMTFFCVFAAAFLLSGSTYVRSLVPYIFLYGWNNSFGHCSHEPVQPLRLCLQILVALIVYCQNHRAPPTSHQRCGAPPPHINAAELCPLTSALWNAPALSLVLQAPRFHLVSIANGQALTSQNECVTQTLFTCTLINIIKIYVPHNVHWSRRYN